MQIKFKSLNGGAVPSLRLLLLALVLGMLASVVVVTASAEGQAIDRSGKMPLPVLSVFLSIDDPDALTQSVDRLVALHRQKRAQIGTVSIVGDLGRLLSGTPFTAQTVKEIEHVLRQLGSGPVSTEKLAAASSSTAGSGSFTDDPAYRRLLEIGIENSHVSSVVKQLDQYQINSSPTWLVSHLGKQQIYEGYADPREFLDRKSLDQASADGVQHHVRQNTRAKLRQAAGVENSLVSGMALIFEMKGSSEHAARNESVVSYQELPPCPSAKTDLEQVYNNTAGSARFDFVYYDPYDEGQRENAKRYRGYSIPYSPLLIKDPRTGEVSPLQGFARMVEIRCLPTRFRFVAVGATRYAEYRQGAEAWKNE